VHLYPSVCPALMRLDDCCGESLLETFAMHSATRGHGRFRYVDLPWVRFICFSCRLSRDDAVLAISRSRHGAVVLDRLAVTATPLF
jgi:hypothetical protein